MACLIDGDVVRRGDLRRGLGFSAADRLENVRRVAALATRLTHDIDVVVAMVSPTEQIRASARALPGVVMVASTVRPRSPGSARLQGVYRRPWDAAAYEPPDPADTIIDTSRTGVTDCVDRILRAARIP